MTNYKSYDALTGAKEDFVREIGGRDIKVPKTLPAIVSINYQRKARKVVNENDALDVLLDLGEAMLGGEREHCSHALELPHLLAYIQELMVYYGLKDAEDEVEIEGKGEAPATEAKPEAKPEAKLASPSPTTISSENGEPSTLISSNFGLTPAPGSIAAN